MIDGLVEGKDMNRLLNIIIFSFFAVLTTLFNMGLNLFIPIVCFLVFVNYKNLPIILISSFISLFLFNQQVLITYLLFMGLLSLYALLLRSKQNYFYNIIFVLCANIITSLLLLKVNSLDEFLIISIYAFIGVILFGYFQFNLEGSIYKQNKIRNYTYIEFIMAIISVFGSTQVVIKDVNVSLFVSIFFSMYFSYSKNEIHSLFFSIITMFALRFMFNIQESILIPFVSAFYMFPGLYSAITLISFCLFAYIGDFQAFSPLTLQITVFVAIFFEFVKWTIVSKDPYGETIGINIYDNLVDLLNTEVIGFASFLDLYAKEFAQSKEFEQKLSEGINSLTSSYCVNCFQKSECFRNNQSLLYIYYKTLILYPTRPDIETFQPELSQIIRNCQNYHKMKKASLLINERLNIAKSSSKNNALVAQINGISNILKQYSVDFTTKREIDYQVFSNIKKSLTDYGFDVTLFNCKKSFVHDFLIEVGIRGIVFVEVKEIIEKIVSNHLESSASAIFTSSSRNRVYFNIVPKIRFEVEYGYGSIAQDGNNICGDNYLIKELDTARIIAAISDGMGKGYLAHQESNKTLWLIDEITNWNLDSSTALQILNTFYAIQDYQERYSTLDFLEINRSNGQMSLYKMGGATTLLVRRDGNSNEIKNKTLPIGLEELINVETFELADQDLIILASDGVFDSSKNQSEIKTLIANIKHLPPQKIAYEILNFTLKNTNKRTDDLSVIALKVSLVN